MDDERTAEGTGETREGIEVELGEEATLEGDGTGEALPDAADFARTMAQIPQAPWTVDLHNSVTHYAELPNGGILMQVTPVLVGPGGQLVTLAPGVRIWFSKDGWANFQREVEAGGVKSKVHRATQLPPGVKL